MGRPPDVVLQPQPTPVATVPEFAQKGSILSKMDEISQQPTRRDAFLTDLRDATQSYVDILVKYGVVTAWQADHLRVHWFPADWQDPSSDCLWREHQPLEPILRQGARRAFEEAQARNLPIDSYWICVGNQVGEIVAWNARQVTRLRVTPPLPEEHTLPEDHPRLTHTDPLVVIKRQDGEVSAKPVKTIP